MKLKVPSELQAAYDRLMKSAALKLRRNDVFKKSTLAYLALGGEALARYHIEISQKDEFWLKNILSMDKIRKHFDKLTLIVKGGESDAKRYNF